jgi:small-conductance mechanosensitive channel
LVSRIPGVIEHIIRGIDGVRFDRAHFRSFGDSALEFEYVYYVLTPDYSRFMDLQQQINLEIMQRFERAKLEFAFPTRTLHLHVAADEKRSEQTALGVG